MAFAPLCMAGGTPECCAAVSPFQVEPCVHTMMDGMPAAFVPLVNGILDGCSIVMPAKCGAVVAPTKPEFACDQCAEFAASIDLMVIAAPCMSGASPECCAAVQPFKIEPCVNEMMDGMSPAFVPLVNQILDGCAIVLPTKCGTVVAPPQPEFACDQCAEFTASLDLMVIAAPCMSGASPECCATVQPFQVEPCVHEMMDGMSPAFKPLVDQILDGCSVVMPARCNAATVTPASQNGRRLLETASGGTCTACEYPDSPACASAMTAVCIASSLQTSFCLPCATNQEGKECTDSKLSTICSALYALPTALYSLLSPLSSLLFALPPAVPYLKLSLRYGRLPLRLLSASTQYRCPFIRFLPPVSAFDPFRPLLLPRASCALCHYTVQLSF